MIQVGTHRMTDRLDDADLAEAVSVGSPWYDAGGVVAVALLVVAGLL